MMGDPSIAAGALSAEVESIERQLERLKAKASGAESRLNAAREEVQKKVNAINPASD
jgi:chaperonin cofactor prefoldin